MTQVVFNRIDGMLVTSAGTMKTYRATHGLLGALAFGAGALVSATSSSSLSSTTFLLPIASIRPMIGHKKGG